MNSVYRTLHIIFIHLLNANKWAITTSYHQYHQNHIVDSIFFNVYNTFPTKRLIYRGFTTKKISDELTFLQ